ncbi:MAG: hypothetical protein SFW09_17795 [Hyphomicrobiaceae bacterium]|nr:hypothetical protein [Hyphomicrobiaceae bacterium]
MRLGPLIARLALAGVLLVITGVLMPLLARAETLFTSLEKPPAPVEVAELLARGVVIFEMDFDQPGAAEAVAAVRAGGGKVTAYHVGGGGGRAWGSVKAGEFVRYYDDPKDFAALTEDVKRLVARGASFVHFDNTHRMSGKRLEAVADAIRAGGAGFVAKNNPDKWRLVMTRRPDLVPGYAIVEDAMRDAEETQAAFELHERGVPVTIVGFRKPIDPKAVGIPDEYAAAYKAVNPWAQILLMDDERAFDSRTARFF